MWLDSVAEYLEDNLTGYTRGASIFTDHLPDSPDSAICVYDGGGNTAPQGPDCPLAEYVVEVRARSTSRASADTLMTLVRGKLHFQSNYTMDGTLKIRWSRALSEPSVIEIDSHRRVVFLGRFTLIAERSDLYA